jgi:hypothetical protein
MTDRPTVLAAVVLALALLGDSLLYAVLPLHASTFGISLGWVGVLLSANRIVRLALYPFLARLAKGGTRRFTIAAAALAAASTLTFSVGSGGWTLLTSRVAWGAAFAALSLSALTYATECRETAGRRVGMSLALREAGPLLALTLGSGVAALAGVRPALAALGMLSLAGVLVAARLPERQIFPPSEPGEGRRRRLSEPADGLSFTAGFVADGIFPSTIALLVAQSAGAGLAVVGAGALLGFRRLAVMLLAPASGRAVDRFGGHIVTAGGFAAAAAGAWMLSRGGVIPGAVFVVSGAAVIATALPVSVATAADSASRVGALARNAMARDAGAAAGPVVALLWFEVAGPLVLYAASGALLAAGAILLLVRPAVAGESPTVAGRSSR